MRVKYAPVSKSNRCIPMPGRSSDSQSFNRPSSSVSPVATSAHPPSRKLSSRMPTPTAGRPVVASSTCVERLTAASRLSFAPQPAQSQAGDLGELLPHDVPLHRRIVVQPLVQQRQHLLPGP